MTWVRIIQVDPGELRLPPGRFTGSDPLEGRFHAGDGILLHQGLHQLAGLPLLHGRDLDRLEAQQQGLQVLLVLVPGGDQADRVVDELLQPGLVGGLDAVQAVQDERLKRFKVHRSGFRVNL